MRVRERTAAAAERKANWASWMAVRSGLAVLPTGISWRQIAGVGALAGIGFSVSIFITDLAFSDSPEAAQAKIGVTAAALVASVLGWLLLRGTSGAVPAR